MHCTERRRSDQRTDRADNRNHNDKFQKGVDFGKRTAILAETPKKIRPADRFQGIAHPDPERSGSDRPGSTHEVFGKRRDVGKKSAQKNAWPKMESPPEDN